MTFADLFAGIGGFRLGLERAGHTYGWGCEIDRYCRAVYAASFGREPEYGDIRDITDAPYVDIVAGGFPCQPFSVAGKRRGAADERNLWPEMLRIVKAVRPVWVVGENVPGLGDYLDTVGTDLEALSYEVLPLEIPAAAFGAPHLRFRLFIVAHAVGRRCESGTERSGREAGADARGRCKGTAMADTEKRTVGAGLCQAEPTQERRRRSGNGSGTSANTDGARLAQRQRKDSEGTWTICRSVLGGTEWWATEPDVGRVAHGVPARVDRLKALGNAVVPQVVEWIGRRIAECEKGLTSPP
jgi:DNA (cytosine-5)-methyltransferase 1